jgi:hypothetical protein
MDDALPMRVVQRTRDFSRYPHRFRNRQLPFANQSAAQRLAGHHRHHVVQQSSGIAAVEQRQDMRMLQLGRGFDLGEETIGAQR